MLTFTEFVSEARHAMCANSYKDWGLIHPDTGALISGPNHPKATHHNDLKRHLKKKIPNIHRAAEYVNVDFGSSGEHPSGFLGIRNVHPGNKHTVLKAYNNLPHHASGDVHVNEKTGNRLQMYNKLRSDDFPY